MRKYETVTLHTLIQGLHVKDFKCFYAKPYIDNTHRIPYSEQKKVDQVVLEWIYWIFEELIIPLLKVSHLCHLSTYDFTTITDYILYIRLICE